MMEPEHAVPWLLKDGKLNSPMSLSHFLEDVPFYCLYDDVICERPIEPEEKNIHETAMATGEEEATSLTSSLWKAIW